MYDQHFGLTGRPFQLTPDPRFYFESVTHRKALSYLGYGLAQGEGFIVITGEIGAGKSTLVAHLTASIDRSRLTVGTIVTTQLESDGLVGMVAESFGVPTQGLDKPQLLRAIETFLNDEARAGRRCLLIVDEAQNLPVLAIEELRMLSNFQLGASPLLQIFLLGQPEFRDMVRSSPALEQLRQRIIANHHLDPMGPEEVEPYVVHRLQKVGWDGSRPSFAADVFGFLHEETGGVPRRLNTLLNRVMLMGAVENVDRIDTALIEAVLADLRGEPFDYDAPLSSRLPEDAAARVADQGVKSGPIADAVMGVGDDSVSFAETPANDRDRGEAWVTEPATLASGTAAQIFSSETASRLAEMEEAFKAAGPGLREDNGTTASLDGDNAVNIADFRLAIDRVCALEQRVAEQQASLRRVLDMLVDWVEHDMDQTSASRGRAA